MQSIFKSKTLKSANISYSIIYSSEHSLQLLLSIIKDKYSDKISRLIKNFIKTDTFQLFTKHEIAGRLFNIPLVYDLALWNRFLIKKEWMDGHVGLFFFFCC